MNNESMPVFNPPACERDRPDLMATIIGIKDITGLDLTEYYPLFLDHQVKLNSGKIKLANISKIAYKDETDEYFGVTAGFEEIDGIWNFKGIEVLDIPDTDNLPKIQL